MKLFKNLKQVLITISFPLILVLVFFTYPISDVAMADGGTSVVGEVIKMEETVGVNNFSSVYVFSIRYVTPFMKLIDNASKHITVYKTTITGKDDREMGKLSKKISIEQSIITAYELAKIKHPEKNYQLTHEKIGYYIYNRSMSFEKQIEIGSVITAINEEINLTPGKYPLDGSKTLVLKMLDKSTVTLDIANSEGIIIEPAYEINYDTAVPKILDVPALKGTSGGPSAGMIQTLQIYYSLLGTDLGNLKIAGTGTIVFNPHNPSESIVGKIGGLLHKLNVVEKNKMDLFIVSSSNQEEIKEPGKVPIEYVLTIADAIMIVDNLLTMEAV